MRVYESSEDDSRLGQLELIVYVEGSMSCSLETCMEVVVICCPRCGYWNRKEAQKCALCRRSMTRGVTLAFSASLFLGRLTKWWNRFADWVWKIWEDLTGYGR